MSVDVWKIVVWMISIKYIYGYIDTCIYNHQNYSIIHPRKMAKPLRCKKALVDKKPGKKPFEQIYA